MAPPLPFDPIDEAARQWTAHWPQAPVAAMSAVTSVMRAQQILLGRLNEALEPFGLTFARYEALLLLYFSRAGSLPLGKMGTRLQVHPASVTNLINGLEADGFVRRAPHPSDRRTTLATITELGREVAEEATARMHEIRFGTAPLDDAQLQEITEVLRSARRGAGDFSDAAEPARPAGA